MKKRTLGRLGVLALVLTLVTTTLLSGTLAKYTTTVTGTGTATVAKFAVKAGDTDGGTAINNFNLGETTPNGVAADRIAPGTIGKFPVYVDLGGTEVATRVEVSLTITDKAKLPANFTITCDGTKYAMTDFTDGTAKPVFTKELTVAEIKANGKLNTEITWEWPMGDGTTDEADTKLGVDALSAAFTVKVVATQLDEDPSSSQPA